jgi:hypothetical protein
MKPESAEAYIAFAKDRRIASGDLRNVVGAAKRTLDRDADTAVLVFDGSTGEPIELDFRGTMDDVLARLPQTGAPAVVDDTVPASPRGPGRPRLGVVAREVTLLPRHWQWLAQQSGGASVAIRRLVEQARRADHDGNRVRQARQAAYRFMSVMAGDRPHYEDALRALFADDPSRFEKLIADWPDDVRGHALMLAQRAFDREPPARAVDPASVNR